MAKTRITNFRLDEDEYATTMMIAKKRQTSTNSIVNDLLRTFNKQQCAKLDIEPVKYAEWSAQNPKQHNKGLRKVETKVKKVK
jgi:hypothetical protein